MVVEYRSLGLRYGCAVVIGILYLFGVLSQLFFSITIAVSHTLLSIWFPVLRAGDLLVVQQSPYHIVEACVATSAYVLWALLVLTTRNVGRQAGKLLGFGWIAIFVVNMVRIVGLIFVDQQFGAVVFTTLHLLIWYLLGSVFVLGLWILVCRRYQIYGIPLLNDLQDVRKLAFPAKRRRW